MREQLDELRSGGWERSARDASGGAAGRHRRLGRGARRRASCRSSSRRSSTPATGRPPRSGSPRSTRPTRRSPRACRGSPAEARRRRRRPPVAGAREADALPRLRLLDLAPALLGHADPDRPLRELRRRCRCPSEDLPVVLPRDIEPTGEGNPLAERPDFVDVACPRCGEPAKRETDTLDCHFDALWLWVPAAVPPEGRAEQMFTHPDLRSWLPSERLVAGNDSGGFVFDQRVVTKALRDIGPFAFLEDGEPFAGCLFHEMVDRRRPQDEQAPRQRRRPRRAGRPSTAPTPCASAILYAAGPAKTLNWNDGAMRFAGRFLQRPLGLRARPLRRALEARAGRRGGRSRHRLHARAPAANGATTASRGSPRTSSELQMHKAVRNVTRLFERIQDFEKRVVKRRGRLEPGRRRGAGRGAGPARPGAGAVRPAFRRGAADRGWTRGRGRVAEPLAPTGRVAILIAMFELQRGNLDKRRMRFAKAGGLPSRTRSCAGR